jgi:hypothetical protein
MQDRLLVVDAMINLVLGVLLVAFPKGLVVALGIPPAETAFYPNILSAVLCGIGVALLLEYFHDRSRTTGLGLGGALSINPCGGLVLAGWLTVGELSIPLRGYLVLWGLVLIRVVVSVLELFVQVRRG